MATTRKTLAPNDPRHGTANGYGNLRCRCDRCREAWRDYVRGKGYASYATDACPSCGAEKRITARFCRSCYEAEVRVEHGSEGSYLRGCRCDECREVANAARRRRRHADLEAARAYDREYKRRVTA